MTSNKILFYLSRIPSMSIPEIMYRIRWKLRIQLINRLKLHSGYYNKQYNKSKSTLNNFKDSKNFFFEHYKQKEVIKAYKKYFNIKKLINQADKYCKHIIPIFEINKNLGKNIEWNKDYKSGNYWPKKYIGNLHHADTRYGDVRYVWELNRHSHLTVIARSYYLTKKERYAEEALQQIETWIAQNPPFYTINWFSGLELGVRLINWIWSLKFIQDYPGLDEARFQKILKSIYLQTDTIYNNLSLYSSANNHLTGEIAAIKLVARVFPDFIDSRKWEKISNQLLKQTISQIHEDGAGAEQSTNYLIFILDLYLQAQKTFPSRIKQSGIFISSLLENRNDLPNIGDSDDAHLTDLLEEDRNKAESILNSLSILYSNKSFKYYGKKIDEKTFWLFGIKGLKRYHNIKQEKPKTKSNLFNKGGYFISPSKKASLIFDCGPLGYLSTAAHGHCDALSFILSVDKKEIFIDPGTYVYHGDQKWRDYFRSTEAHNTIKIDGKNQSQITGPFTYGKKAKTKILYSKIAKEKDEIVAVHNGYKSIGAIHQREIIHLKNKREIIINDTIKTKNKHSIALHFNLSPNVKIQRNEDSFLLKQGNTKVRLKLAQGFQLKQHHGNLHPLKGWFSPKFGVRIPSTCIEAKRKIRGKTQITTQINY